MNYPLKSLAKTVFIFLMYGCANVGSPTGGPQDELPPILISSNPDFGELNVSTNEITLTFNELITVDNLNKNLIITPRIDQKYKFIVRRNLLTLEFEDKLDTGTTYNFNFGAAIKDITEGNIAEDVRLAFSTGSYLDSLSVTGKIINILTQEPIEQAIAALYKTDTTNPVEDPPYYLTKTDKEGNYSLQNLKNGSYRLYAYADKNNNLLLDLKTERYGFLPETIMVNQDTSRIIIPTIQVNADSIAVINSRINGIYYDINYNKPLKQFNFRSQQETVEAAFTNNNKTIRFYSTKSPISDSIQAEITATDSIGNVLQEKFYLKFEESKKEKQPLEVKIEPSSGKAVAYNYEGILTFSKPITNVNTDTLRFIYDTLNIIPITQKDLKWNDNKTILTINKNLKDIEFTYLDSTNTILGNLPDTITEEQIAQLRSRISEINEALGKNVSLSAAKGTFISADKDTLPTLEAKYTFIKSENFGTITGKIETETENFFVQLIDKAGKVIVSQAGAPNGEYAFKTVPPGDYKIRILVDKNNNGEWDPGNIHLNLPPEPVIIYEKVLPLKANWELRDENIVF